MTTQIKREPGTRPNAPSATTNNTGNANGNGIAYTRREDDAAEFDLSQQNNKIWLVRLPKFLYDRWASAEPGAELGSMRINETNRREMRIVTTVPPPAPPPPPSANAGSQQAAQDAEADADADGDVAGSQQQRQQHDGEQRSGEEDGEAEADESSAPVTAEEDIPTEYALAMQNQVVNNTYVFSEPPPVLGAAAAVKSSGGAEDEDMRYDSDDEQIVVEQRRPAGGPDRARRNQGGQRLRGKVVHECLVKPIDDARYRSLLKARSAASDKPRRQIQTIDDMSGNFLQPGLIGPAQGSTGKFMQAPSKKRNREIHARLPIDALMDSIFKCFEEYEFWSLKAFKHQLKQPESYLKEVLEGIATLHKRGPHTGRWQLKQETKGAISGLSEMRQGQAAPDEQFESSDDDVEMEDRL